MDTSYNRLNYTVPPTRHRRNYKPLILRVPCMLFVALIACGLIGILEYASRELPHANRGHHSPIDNVLDSLHKRATVSSASTVTSTPVQSDDVSATVPESDYITTKKTSTSSGEMVPLTADSGDYVTKSSTVGSPTVAPYAPTSDYVSTSVSIASSAPSSDYIKTEISTSVTRSITQTTSATSSIITTDAQGQATTVQTIVAVTTVAATVVPTVASVSVDGNSQALQRLTVATWPLWKVFVGNYLPVIAAIIFKLFWTSIYNKIKLIEPFTRLTQPNGAIAADTLHTYYLSSNLTPDPIVSLFKGHWLILWSSLVYTVAAILPSLSTEVIFLDTNWSCPNPDFSNRNPCWPPKLSVDPTVVRWLQGLLGYIAVMTIGLMIMLLRAKTGLSHDPSSIASISALVHHTTVLEDFRSFRDEASIKEIRARLGSRRYKLDDYRRADGTWRYGIVPIDAPIDYEWDDKQYAEKHAGLSNGARRQRRLDTIWDLAFLLFLTGVEGVVIAYFKASGHTGFNDFFNSNTFGPRFFMAAMATIISLNWKRLEREVHALTPYHELARSPAPAKSTILLRKRSLPYTAFFGMVYHKHFFAASLAVTAISSDFLVVSLAGVPYSPGQIFMELLVCSYASMAILGTMILSIAALLLWRRRSPDLPRAPDTIMAVVSYVADSNMLEDFDDTSMLKKKEVDDRINGLGKRYGYSRSIGMDGQKRFMVDEEFKLMV